MLSLTYEQAHALLPWAIVAYGCLCILFGYCVGSARTFASLCYLSESTWQSLRTMLPWYGNKRLRDDLGWPWEQGPRFRP